MKITKSDLVAIINEEIENILNEEAYDCMQDYKAGGLTWEEYQDCLKQFRDQEKSYTRLSMGPNTQSLSYQKSIVDYLEKKENKYLRSVLRHIENGKNISREQRPIVDKILGS
jgi:hypothetical protein